MKFIYTEYNMYHNSIDITPFDGYLLRIGCNKAEDCLRTTPYSECTINPLAIDEPLEYARLYLERNMRIWGSAFNVMQDGWFMVYFNQDYDKR